MNCGSHYVLLFRRLLGHHSFGGHDKSLKGRGCRRIFDIWSRGLTFFLFSRLKLFFNIACWLIRVNAGALTDSSTIFEFSWLHHLSFNIAGRLLRIDTGAFPYSSILTLNWVSIIIRFNGLMLIVFSTFFVLFMILFSYLRRALLTFWLFLFVSFFVIYHVGLKTWSLSKAVDWRSTFLIWAIVIFCLQSTRASCSLRSFFFNLSRIVAFIPVFDRISSLRLLLLLNRGSFCTILCWWTVGIILRANRLAWCLFMNI